MLKSFSLFIIVACALVTLSDERPLEESRNTSELNDLRNEESILLKLIYLLFKTKSVPSSKNEVSIYGGNKEYLIV